jgi:sigma-54 dependent transcriptional regulator, acetoin dehydrogenase operon transcriptional activator AcoR
VPAPPGDRTLSRGSSRRSSARVAQAAWALTVLHSPRREWLGRSVPLGRQLRLGRGAGEVDLQIDDPKLSRVHALVSRAGLVFEIRDLGSRNGTFINGERVERHSLTAGDVVRVGDTLFEIGPEGPRPPAEPGDPLLVARSASLIAAVEAADRVAPSDLSVLLLGETGTGKEVFARRVHGRSGRRGAFLAINCASLPRELVESTLFGHKKGAFTGATSDSDGLFAQAQDGTLFLDEVGELPAHQQAKLLRVLENHEYLPVGSTRVVQSNARIIAASNADLDAEIASGGFRADLYARLAGTVIRLPPLRSRRRDILALAESFFSELAPGEVFRLSASAAEKLVLHPWPHNVRELRGVMQRLTLLQPAGGEVSRRTIESALDSLLRGGRAAVSPEQRSTRGPRGAMPGREELVARLAALNGNVNRLAEQYGKDPKQIYRWLKRHGLDPAAFR